MDYAGFFLHLMKLQLIWICVVTSAGFLTLYFRDKLPGDTFFNFDGVDLVVSSGSKDLTDGMTIDYVELEPGKPEFIFLNPNDPSYVPPGD